MRTRGVVMLAAMRAFLVCFAFVAACGDAPRELKVSAAMSLKEVFGELEAGFEAAHPGIDLVYNFAGSQILAGQIVEGAPADVFAAADEPQMQRAIETGRVAVAAVFARNRLVVISPIAAPLAGPEALAIPGLRVVLAGPGVPAGAYARAALHELGLAAGTLANVVSNEENVRGVVGKISAGEADAGIVYATDVTPAIAATLHVQPLAVSVSPRYEVAVLEDSPVPALARDFVAALQGPEGQAALARHGFLPP